MGSYRTYSIPGKAAALVPEFAVEDLPLAELQPRFLRLQWRTCPWAEDSDDDDADGDDDYKVGLHYRKKCNTFKDKFIVLKIDVGVSLSLQEYMITWARASLPVFISYLRLDSVGYA